MERVDWQRFDYSQLDNVPVLERKVGNPAGTKHRPDYLPFIATFDTETTTIEIKKRKHAFVYVWMFYLPHIDTMITGRTIEEYIVFAEILSGHLQGNLLVYVHNLSFDWQFMAGVYQFGKDGIPDVFSVKPRKILTPKSISIRPGLKKLSHNGWKTSRIGAFPGSFGGDIAFLRGTTKSQGRHMLEARRLPTLKIGSRTRMFWIHGSQAHCGLLQRLAGQTRQMTMIGIIPIPRWSLAMTSFSSGLRAWHSRRVILPTTDHSRMS